MITKKALIKTKDVLFSEKYGIEATPRAFGIKRRTFFNWKKAYIQDGKIPEALNKKSKLLKQSRVQFRVDLYSRKPLGLWRSGSSPIGGYT